MKTRLWGRDKQSLLDKGSELHHFHNFQSCLMEFLTPEKYFRQRFDQIVVKQQYNPYKHTVFSPSQPHFHSCHKCLNAWVSAVVWRHLVAAPYLIPVCFCTESHSCSCSAREARCRKPTDPSCIWSRLYRVQMSEGCSGFEDLRGKHRNSYRNTAFKTQRVPKTQRYQVSSVWRCLSALWRPRYSRLCAPRSAWPSGYSDCLRSEAWFCLSAWISWEILNVTLIWQQVYFTHSLKINVAYYRYIF